MGLYRFEKNIENLDKKHSYFAIFLGDSYSNDKINVNNTVFITIETMELIEDILTSINKNYDHYGVTKYNKDQTERFTYLLKQRVIEIENDDLKIINNDVFSKNWEDILIYNYKNNKNKIIKIFKDILDWLNNIEIEIMEVVMILE